MGLSGKEIGANDNVGGLAEKPGSNWSTIEKHSKARDCRFDRTLPAAILSFSFNKATPPDFAPKRQLPLPTTGALHCTGTVAGGIFRGDIEDI
ncbi:MULTISPECIES: hypothetical protein [Pseudomonas]|uniref:hypothetical protein n=1 Tax=Pseudomonas TaxID=286 RepID=UPI0012B535B8|nr:MULTISPECIES: hypothetical protein [Pseudomonas]MBL0841279.1 hypothetical protein [Pseudomonas mediterranea]MDU9027360.1 hypothetical protein [Pseudomonas mediterranea]QHA81320.1 hypothetical protein E3Z27_06300 [Pseudomonas mediterranea]UZE02283.1 hypothetical protein LOY71_06525 [Pseudomonas mediterranea]